MYQGYVTDVMPVRITKGDKVMKINSSEKGQALIVIAFAAIVLFSFAALAIDGSRVFSDKRHAQNAADTAVLAAALAKVRGQSFSMAAASRATSNGYNNNGTTNIVVVYNPPMDGNYAGNSEYIQVKITSHVNTVFAQIIGVPEMVNHAEAVARTTPSTTAAMYGGSAVVALDPSGCKAVQFNGNANMTLTGSGIYVNSTCTPNAFNNDSGSSGILSTPCLQTVGGYSYSSGKVVVTQAGCLQNNAPKMSQPQYPNITCGTQTATQNGDTLSAGNWNGAFPPNGVTYLQSGVYCVSNGNFQINGGSTLIGHGVVIYMMDGFVKWNGGANIQLDAPTDGPYKGLLLYLPPTNSNVVVVNGNGDSHISGSIWAPSSTITVEGGGGSAGLQCQFLGWRVNLSGSSNTNIDFQANLNFQPPSAPNIELAQ
jgi:Flp pilus assembly protein TadG